MSDSICKWTCKCGAVCGDESLTNATCSLCMTPVRQRELPISETTKPSTVSENIANQIDPIEQIVDTKITQVVDKLSEKETPSIIIHNTESKSEKEDINSVSGLFFIVGSILVGASIFGAAWYLKKG